MALAKNAVTQNKRSFESTTLQRCCSTCSETNATISSSVHKVKKWMAEDVATEDWVQITATPTIALTTNYGLFLFWRIGIN